MRKSSEFLPFAAVILLAIITTSIKAERCAPGEHWVSPHHRRTYHRADGTFVKAANVSGHCQGNPSDYDVWNPKLMDGRPMSWRHNSEESKKWTSEERERVLETLGETPSLLKNRNINGIYRMGASDYPDNPASNNLSDFVLYDNAFEDEKYNLTHVLNHELCHRLFDDMSTEDQRAFQQAGGWREEKRNGKTVLVNDRREEQFVRKNDMLSPIEDFADSVTAYIHEPTKLKRIAPSVFGWIDKHFGPKLKKKVPK
jgi:hypothetical protein